MAGIVDLINAVLGAKAPQKNVTDSGVAPIQEMAKTVSATPEQQAEIEELAKIIAAESASLGERGMMATAHVINNRAGKNSTPYKEATRKNQFYGYTNKNKDKIYQGVKEQALGIATKLYNGQLGEDFTGGAKYFRQPTEKVQPWHKEQTITIGNHIFYK